MENNQVHILIVDDDNRIRDLLSEYLKENNYIVSTSENAENAKIKISYFKFDLIVLDVMMPGQDGYDLTKEIKKDINIPIILLTAKDEVQNRIKGLELGADDYMPKPFEPEELIARIQSILRRSKSPERMIDNLIFEHLSIDKLKQEVMLNGQLVALSTTEFEALLLFAENCGQILDRDFLVENLRGISWQSYDRSIDVLVSRLRSKLNQ